MIPTADARPARVYWRPMGTWAFVRFLHVTAAATWLGMQVAHEPAAGVWLAAA